MNAPVDPASLQTAGNASMIVMALGIGLFELLIGAAIGWWLRGSKAPADVGAAPAAASGDQRELQQAEHALSNLRELAARVQADVGAHSSNVEAISHQLTNEQASGDSGGAGVTDAIAKILQANRQLEQKLHSAEDKLKQQAEQIKQHAANALTDALTGLGNRRAFDAELARRSAEFQRHGNPFCLMMLDVDHFKKFNDSHGHLAGDEVLRLVGKTLKNSVRIPDFVARYGGEEFGVVMPQTVLADAPVCAERIRSAVEQAICEFDGKQLQVTVSIGVSQINSGQGPNLLVENADKALYAAKQGGRNRVELDRGENLQQQAKPAPVEPVKAAAPAPKAPAPVDTIEKKSIPVPARSEKENKAVPAESEVDHRTDQQTGLPNRTAFCEEIRRRLSEAQRLGNRLTLLLVKIDDLDSLVGRYGKQVGQVVVSTCTQFLGAAMREMDMVSRYDQDMFGIILPGTALVHATGAAERLRAAIEQCPLRVADREIRFTISAGLAEAQPGDDMVSLLTRTDESNQAARAGGGNAVRFHSGRTIESLKEVATAASG
jgi:diguanylate cyclase